MIVPFCMDLSFTRQMEALVSWETTNFKSDARKIGLDPVQEATSMSGNLLSIPSSLLDVSHSLSHSLLRLLHRSCGSKNATREELSSILSLVNQVQENLQLSLGQH